MITGDLIREARLRAGLTQTQLGERLGKAQSEIGRWERGEVLPSLETVREIVRACDLDLQFQVVPRDDSLLSLIDQHLAMTTLERVAHSKRRAAFRVRRERLASQRAAGRR